MVYETIRSRPSQTHLHFCTTLNQSKVFVKGDVKGKDVAEILRDYDGPRREHQRDVTRRSEALHGRLTRRRWNVHQGTLHREETEGHVLWCLVPVLALIDFNDLRIDVKVVNMAADGLEHSCEKPIVLCRREWLIWHTTQWTALMRPIVHDFNPNAGQLILNTLGTLSQ